MLLWLFFSNYMFIHTDFGEQGLFLNPFLTYIHSLSLKLGDSLLKTKPEVMFFKLSQLHR